MSGVVLKGALVTFARRPCLPPVPDVIIFQYNPETMTHTSTQPGHVALGRRDEGTNSNPLAVEGRAGETYLLHHTRSTRRRSRRWRRAQTAPQPRPETRIYSGWRR